MQENIISGKKVIQLSVCFIFICFFFFDTHAINLSKDTNPGISPGLLLSDILSNESSVFENSDSITYYTRGANGLIILPPSDWDPFPYNVKFRDTVIYNPAFLPVVFDGKVLPSDLDFMPKDSKKKKNEFHLIPREETLAPLIKKARDVENLRRDYYTNINNISYVKYSVSALKKIPKLDFKDVTKRNIFHDLIVAEEPIKIPPIDLKKSDPKYIYWIKNGEHSLHIIQNYMTDNWYKGGNKNLSLRNYHKLLLNYAKDKITFNNTLEWKFSLQQTPADTVNAMNITEDLIRIENVFGYQAFNKWSYSVRLETKTQLFNSYPVNGDKKNTAFLSPLVMNVGIGMNYSTEKKYESDSKKIFKLALALSPFSLNYTYVRDDEVVPTKFGGIKEGDNSRLEIGSLINADLSFSLNRYMSITSRFKYFTNYERAEMEFENKFDMLLNRFLSTSVYLYLRFDDSVSLDKKEKNIGYFQLNELISFGLNYKW